VPSLARSRRCRVQLAVTVLVTALGCPSDDDGQDDGPLACVDVDADGCAPLYAPTWDNVFAMTLTPDCTTGGLSCHASADALGAAEHGLFFADPEGARALLLEDRGDATFVVPGDPSCSQLVIRLVTEDTVKRMPPGLMLSPEETCSVMQWVEMGAMP
jgi:hypothetical protein